MSWLTTIRILLCLIIGLISMSCTKKKLTQTSSSMEPSVMSGEVVEVDLKAYSRSNPKRWDVVIFSSPTDGESNWISRVVGLPGEMVDVREDGLYVDSKKITVPARLGLAPYRPMRGVHGPGPRGKVTFPYAVPAGSYFLLGDNVENALDGRYWGGINEDEIRGKVLGK